MLRNTSIIIKCTWRYDLKILKVLGNAVRYSRSIETIGDGKSQGRDLKNKFRTLLVRAGRKGD